MDHRQTLTHMYRRNPAQPDNRSQAALAYLRVSTDRQDLSLEAQAEQVQRAATYHQLPEPMLFSDEDRSGSIPFLDREGAAELCVEIVRLRNAGCDVTLFVPKVDRFGRDTVDIISTAKRLGNDLGVRLCFLDINVDTKTATGMAFLQLCAVFAELELARIRERIQTALDLKKSKGELCGTLPYGWDAIETGEVRKGVATRRLEDNPVEQGWILHMHRRRCEGWGYHSIARELNELGCRAKNGGRWQCGNVHHVLHNATVQAWLDLKRHAAHHRREGFQLPL